MISWPSSVAVAHQKVVAFPTSLIILNVLIRKGITLSLSATIRLLNYDCMNKSTLG